MNSFKIIVLLIAASVTANLHAQEKNLAQNNFMACKIFFEPSITSFHLEDFARQYNAECADVFEVDKAIDLRQVDLSKPPLNPETFTFRPTIQNLFDSPSFQLGEYDNFAGRFKFSNPAFYEANKSSILSSGYQDFICPTGGANF
ncbi:MAG: hypothetical protein WBG46_07015 [Nonlabens sp.]